MEGDDIEYYHNIHNTFILYIAMFLYTYCDCIRSINVITRILPLAKYHYQETSFAFPQLLILATIFSIAKNRELP